jgi:hypothetical protein
MTGAPVLVNAGLSLLFPTEHASCEADAVVQQLSDIVSCEVKDQRGGQPHGVGGVEPGVAGSHSGKGSNGPAMALLPEFFPIPRWGEQIRSQPSWCSTKRRVPKHCTSA